MGILQSIIYFLYILLIVMTIVVIVYDRSEPTKAVAWIVVVALIPVLGFILYFHLGRNHRKEKIFNHKEIKDLEHIAALSEKQLELIRTTDGLNDRNIAGNIDIITLLLNSNKALLTTHNQAGILNDGVEKFDALLQDLENARESIHMEYYIFVEDGIGRRVAEILMRKAREGVEVRFIYDDVGSWSLKRAFINELRESGVDARCFMPVVFPWLTSKINYRNHRKIVVIDGLVGYTGGLNIADRYMVVRGKKRWRDTHIRLEGDSVMMLQAIFVTDWYFVSGKQYLNQLKYFPHHDITDFLPIQIATSGPDSDWASIMQAYFSAISKAEKYIYISTPYFLPDKAILTAIRVAALSGVDVRLLIPNEGDNKVVYWATCSYVADLLRAGVKVYQFRRGFNHAKIIMIDGKLCSVGTANMDIRSFEVNFEVSAFIYDEAFTAQLEETFHKDLRQSRQINPAQWDKRPKGQKFIEFLSSLLSPLF